MRVAVSLLALSLGIQACGGSTASTSKGAAEPEPEHVSWEDPDHDPYNFYRSVSLTLLRTQQYMKASRAIRKMRKLRTSDPEPPYLLACVHIGLKEFALAQQNLNLALELDEKYSPAVATMGSLLNMMGRHKEAHVFHKRAIKLDPTNPAFHNNLGFSLYLAGDTKAAIAAYKAALQEDSGAKRVHNNLGFAYGKLGDMDSAHKHFLLAGVPAQASNNVGFVYEEQGNLPRAYDFYLIAIREDPKLIQARLNLGRVCEQLGRPLPELPDAPPPATDPQPPAEGVDAAQSYLIAPAAGEAAQAPVPGESP